ncbi:uncharacterized protein LOC129905204 [Episyrphus balteatus]|uniref:uncharacterized protein LOC129905204 n=1 Tax=Episyrphus balteatus TaxID=286459 RepID=UPI0024857F80|nr:uncharacterized protein LOC129905204 [Episyrphus balteatus]
MNALDNLKIEDPLKNMIEIMLSSRIISSELGNFKTRRAANRGTPQGGVLSPLLWNLVVNELLLDLEGEGFKVIAYADDVAIAVSGKYPQTLAELLKTALNKLIHWARGCGLDINPHKTELVLFTRKYKIPDFKLPTIKEVTLTLSDQAKYLGLIFDKKLTWKLNIEERVKKANVALFSCKKAIGGKWGFSPNIAHWLYTSVIRPILTYGMVVWWTALDKTINLNKLIKVQRSASICISGALRSTPSDALDILLNLTPLDIFSKQVAASSATRLKATSQWTSNHIGHTNILNIFGFLPDRLDYTTPQLVFDNNFQNSIPSRTEWENLSTLDNDSLHFNTDGSKTNGSGIFSEKQNLSLFFRLPDQCRVFQAEILAIKEVLSWLRENVISNTDIRIFSDSQAAIKSLASVSTNSIMVLDCQTSLREMSEQFNIHLVWVPGHRDIPGNCRADELAKLGTITALQPERNNIGTPIATCKLMLKQDALKKTNLRWTQSNTFLATKQIWPCIDLKRSKGLLNLNRMHISSTIGVLTGHCLIGRHAKRMGVFSNDFCRSCMDEEEEETV